MNGPDEDVTGELGSLGQRKLEGSSVGLEEHLEGAR
jgi:hypothetical protein